MIEIRNKKFLNGCVYALKTNDGFKIETTDTFLPQKTIKCDYSESISECSRNDRWMIGISTMSGCPIHCKFCATGSMNKIKLLNKSEMLEQIWFVLEKNKEYNFNKSYEHKINYTRMGEPFLNIQNVRDVIKDIDDLYPNTHHYISTIGIKDSDFSFIKDNITLQISLHSLDNNRRDELIPYKNKMSIEELGKIRTKSFLKTTINLTLVDEKDFDIKLLNKYFDPKYFFIKLSPINKNSETIKNQLGKGVINGNYCQ